MHNTVGGEYNATPPVLTDKQLSRVQMDANGNLKTTSTPSGSAPVGGGITYADKTVTSATGASQTIAAANAGRKSLIIKTGGSNTGVNILGGTAAIGGAGTVTLLPFEPMVLDGASCPLGAITIISTSTAYISCLEGA